ncbi:MAG TPA: hypothetical protein DIW81_08025 [Planctomycetaceae bacterium]|nr:hypothetical protein [Planctomycetaceae bacterium]
MLLVTIAGCQVVHIRDIPGDAWQWETSKTLTGWWATKTGDVFQVIPLHDGSLLIGHPTRTSEEEFEAISTIATISTVGDHNLIFLKNKKQKDEEPSFLFLLVETSSDELIVLIPPKGDSFVDMIDKHEVNGKRVKYKNSDEFIALITSDSGSFKTMLASKSTEELFDSKLKIELSRVKLLHD